MVKQDDNQDVLASAEAALARAIIGSADIGASWVDTNLKLDKIRIYCRQLRAALVELGRSASTHNLDKSRSCCRELRAVILELIPSASLPFRCLDVSCALSSSPRTPCWFRLLECLIAAPSRARTPSECVDEVPTSPIDQTVYRLNSGFSAQELRPGDLPARPPLLRQAIDLLALILAYLLYFHIDVELQILRLTSLFP